MAKQQFLSAITAAAAVHYSYSRAVTIKASQVGSTDSANFPVPFRTPVGTISTSGTAATWVSGDVFPAALAGNPIFINGVQYTVTTWTDSTHLILSATAGTQTGVAFNCTPYLRQTAYGGKVVSKAGFDIIFTSDAAGTIKLDHEIKNYDPYTGIIAFNFKAPNISHTVDTTVYMWYGASSGSRQAITSLWGNTRSLVNQNNIWNVEAYKNTSGVYVAQSDEGYWAEESSIVTPDKSLSGQWEMFLHVTKFRSSQWHQDIWWYQSADGVNWTRQAECAKDLLRPYVFWNVAAGKYWMYACPPSVTQINLYTSSTQTGFTLDTAGCITAGAVYDTQVNNQALVFDANGNPTDMWYEGFQNSSYITCHASSTDGGRTWTKNPGNPCTWVGQGTPRGFSPNWMTVINGVYYYVCHGGPTMPSSSSGTDIHVLTSTDKLNFTSVGGLGNPIIGRTQAWEGIGAAATGQVADAFVVEYGGSLYIYYEGRSAQGSPPLPSSNPDTIGLVKIPGSFADFVSNVPVLRDSTLNANAIRPSSTAESKVPTKGVFGNTRALSASYTSPSYEVVAHSASLNPGANQSFTLKCLITSPPSAAVMAILSKRDVGQTPTTWYEMQFNASVNTLAWSIQDANSVLNSDASSGGTGTKNIRDGAPHYICLQRDVPNGKIRTFVDGVQEANVTLTASGAIVNVQDFQIGRLSRNSGETIQYFTGSIEHIELTSNVDSVDWILATYNALVNPTAFFAIGNEVAH